jgi:apurinic endonuclease APN1
MRIGAHVSTAGGLANALPRAAAIGAECIQLFVGAPQRWFSAKYSDDDVALFRERAAELGIGPNVVHAVYLVNLASADTKLRDRSIHALVNQMHWCERLGVFGLVVHVGSGKGAVAHDEAVEMVVDGVERVLSRSSTAHFLIENTAGMGTSIGSDFKDIGTIVHRLGRDSRLGVCLDTAHTFEAGHDIRTRDCLDLVLENFDREVGLDRLMVIHANDSKTAFGSNVDRHDNIGAGHLGEECLGTFMTHPAVQELPFYLEVPGIAGHGPDRQNVDALRRLAGLPALELPTAPLAELEDESLVIP